MQARVARVRRPRLRPDQIEGRITAVARDVSRGRTVAAACRAAGIALPSYYRWIAQRKTTGSASAADGGDDLREAVLFAARSVFLREGFGASLEKVAAAAGVARQTVYNLFSSKERLFGEVVQSLYRQTVDPVLVVDRSADLVTMLTDCGRHLLKLMLDPEAVALLRITLGEYFDHPELAAAAYAMRTSRVVPNVSGVIAARLQQEMDLGNLDRVDPFLAAETFIGSFTAHARHRALIGLSPPSPEELEQRLELAIRIFTQGLGYRAIADPNLSNQGIKRQ